MSKLSQTIFKAFLSSCPPKQLEILLSFLPQEDRELLEHLHTPKMVVTQGLAPPKNLLYTLHASWLTPFLRTLAKNDLALFIAALAPTQQMLVSNELGFSEPLPTLRPDAALFIRKLLLYQLQKNRPPLLPIECLPESPFNPLLLFSYHQKMRLLDLLSMYDLANEESHIIQKEKRTLIFNSLSSEQLTLLEKLKQHKERLAFKPMNLQQWEGNLDTLKTLLRQRGINRLSKATWGTDPNFQWHLCHQLDTTSAGLYYKLHTELGSEIALRTLKEQVLALTTLIYDQLLKKGT